VGRALIGKGLAYVDDQDGETISAQRGGFGKPGIESPHRDRSVEENLDLFRKMRAGEFADGSRGAARQDRHAAREHAAA
jgi:glutaminyl-tRNA synthetase